MSTPPSQKKQAAAPTSPHLAMISIGCTRVMNKQKKNQHRRNARPLEIAASGQPGAAQPWFLARLECTVRRLVIGRRRSGWLPRLAHSRDLVFPRAMLGCAGGGKL